MWLLGEGCKSVIQCMWATQCDRVPLFQVCEKIQTTCLALLGWQRNVFGSTRVEIAKVCEQLGMLFDQPPSMEVREGSGC